MPAIDRESLRWYFALPCTMRAWWATTALPGFLWPGRLGWLRRLRFILTILWCQRPPIITHHQ